LFGHLSFRQSLAHLDPQTAPAADASAVPEFASAFYRQQLDRYPEATSYLGMRGLHDPDLIRELEIGYAPGGSLRRHLTALGYSFDLLRQVGLLNANGSDAFYQRIVFPLRQAGHIVNLYGRSIGTVFAHRFLPGSKGGLYAWEKVRHCSEVILVEDCSTMLHSGRRAFTTSPARWEPISTQISSSSYAKACATVYLAFDVDDNRSGQHAAEHWPIAFASRVLLLAASCCPTTTIPTPSLSRAATRSSFSLF